MHQEILEKLPYQKPFLFVDELTEVSQDSITGCYRLKEDEYFYQGHFSDYKVTPGVILTEIAAQIGLVSFGIYLSEQTGKNSEEVFPLFSSANLDFLKSVFPGEKVTVVSEKEYFRFSKLKCRISMFNESEELVLKGTLSGMISLKS